MGHCHRQDTSKIIGTSWTCWLTILVDPRYSLIQHPSHIFEDKSPKTALTTTKSTVSPVSPREVSQPASQSDYKRGSAESTREVPPGGSHAQVAEPTDGHLRWWWGYKAADLWVMKLSINPYFQTTLNHSLKPVNICLNQPLVVYNANPWLNNQPKSLFKYLFNASLNHPFKLIFNQPSIGGIVVVD